MSSTPRVIVVGGGLAGLSAAHTLYEKGASVLHLDKNGFHGGNSTKATSGINGAGTRTQAAQGVPDSKKVFFDDTKKSARDLARDDLIEVLTGKSGEAVDWLKDYAGLELTKLGRLGGHSEPRTHRGTAQFPGMEITYALMEKLEDLAEADPTRMEIIKKADVKELIMENGKVVGCKFIYQGETKTARGPVILATGGYAADFAKDGLLAKHRPDTLELSTTNGNHCTGDGLKMLMAIGGNAVDLEKVQVHPTGLVDPKDPDAKTKFLAAEALRGAGGILLDNEGNRFADELGHRDYVTGRMWDNGKFPIRLILNEASSNDILWHCKHYAGRGLMKRLEGFKGLAEEMKIDESKIKEAYDDYAQIAQGKKKDPFGKKFFDNWKTSESDVFYVAQMMPVLHYTMGGAEIDVQSRVLAGKDRKPIPGVWAAGELGGGVHGANRLGGSSLLGCVVFGRVAGDSAAAYLLKEMTENAGSSPAAQRLNQVANHLETKIRINPENKNVTLEFSWAEQGSGSSQSSSSQSSSSDSKDDVPPPSETNKRAVTGTQGEQSKEPPKEKELKHYTLDEVAKHTSDGDLWVAVNGQVLNVTNFLDEHPGGPQALKLYAGKEASEEFNMLHDPKVVAKYAADTIIGTYDLPKEH